MAQSFALSSSDTNVACAAGSVSKYKLNGSSGLEQRSAAANLFQLQGPRIHTSLSAQPMSMSMMAQPTSLKTYPSRHYSSLFGVKAMGKRKSMFGIMLA